MSLSINIDKLLESNEETFKNILNKLFMENLTNAKKELASTYEFNQKLYEAIEFTLKKLKQEEGFISRVLYSSFGVGKKKNKRRKHLILLGTQLKTEIAKIERDIERLNLYHKNSLTSSDALIRLSNELSKKVHTLDDSRLINRCDKYLKKIYRATDEVNISTKELDLKSIYLESSVDKYKGLLVQIPRYHELRDHKYLEYKR